MGDANGAGKSPLAGIYVADLIASGRFLNADEVARRLAPEDQERAAFTAGKSIVRTRRKFLASRRSFAIESTLGQPQPAADRHPSQRCGLSHPIDLPVHAHAANQ
jgi:predicted ABC-type ATPase